MVKVLHYPSCSKSRAVLEFLDENGVHFELIDLQQDPLSTGEIKTLLKKLGLSAQELIRKNEALYKEKYEGKNLSEEEWIQMLSENPSLIQRPILVKPNVALVARPLENAKYFLLDEGN